VTLTYKPNSNFGVLNFGKLGVLKFDILGFWKISGHIRSMTLIFLFSGGLDFGLLDFNAFNFGEMTFSDWI